MNRISGTHLIVDAYVADPASLSAEHITRVFEEVVQVLEMELLGEPVVRSVPVDPNHLETDQDEGGVSVIMPITTSHLAAHAWPLRSAIMLDIFSCKPFATDAAVRLIVERFGCRHYRHEVVSRLDPINAASTKTTSAEERWMPWIRG